MNKFSKNSLQKLNTCHPELQRLFKAALPDCPIDFGVSHGHRSPEEQFELYKKGRVQQGDKWVIVDKAKVVTNCDGYIVKSNHNEDPSNAVDIFAYVSGKASYKKEHMLIISTHILQKAIELGIKVKAGATFRSFFDGPHYELIES